MTRFCFSDSDSVYYLQPESIISEIIPFVADETLVGATPSNYPDQRRPNDYAKGFENAYAFVEGHFGHGTWRQPN